jgi:hypothetical protein
VNEEILPVMGTDVTPRQIRVTGKVVVDVKPE